ncbi:hypothetical protein LTR64_003525 [Lithohypha guttulata]|uniref:uncharacterized protein n=1 Tax=Lithohypha guttulata TaxID=1690604 RepID=UPI002DDE67E7|nr:hypothetical protein LTR51_000257 [Lithohypha guttulata]
MKFRGVLRSITKAGPTPVTTTSTTSKDACVCVLGVGYVGESLLSQFGNVVDAIGYDISQARIDTLRQKYRNSSRIKLTTNPAEIAKGTHFLIAVPTPLQDDGHGNKSADLHCVKDAINLIITHAQPGSCIIIESSVPVGTTRKLLTKHKSTFHCGMSPERIDPGRITPTAEQIPKVVSALTPKAMKHIFSMYAMVYETLVPVSKPEVAEMTKLYENCYRMVNIAYVNEISDACISHGIDPHEMIGAAATKPFGFQPFYPGLGVGGHCIPINPWYLFENNKRLKVLETATRLMQERPTRQARRFHTACQGRLSKTDTVSETVVGPRILVVGLGFKNGQTNLACSPALSFAQTMSSLGTSRLAFYDPTISSDQVQWMEKLDERHWTQEYIESEFDGVVLCNKLKLIDSTWFDKLRKPLFKDYA